MRLFLLFLPVLVALGASALAAEPALQSPPPDQWIDLFNGKDLSGWHLRDPKGVCGCKVMDGILVSKPKVNGKRSSYLVSDLEFLDFQLQVEFMIPKGSNSGLYLQGRYEIQIADSYGKKPAPGMCGSLYRRIEPRINVCRPPGQWQSYDITFRAPRYDDQGELAEPGRLTLIHNGRKTLDNVAFVGVTGHGWSDQYEGQPGPLVIQTDHGDVSFRKIRIRGTVGAKSFPRTPPAVLSLTAHIGRAPDGFGKAVELDWRTPHHWPAGKFRVYRGASPDFPLDAAHKLTEVRWWPPVNDTSFPAPAVYFYKVVPVGLDGQVGPVAGPVSVSAEPNRAGNVDLTRSAWAAAHSANGPVRRNRSTSNRTLTLAGKKYRNGFGVHAPATIDFLVQDLVGDSPDYHLRGLIGLDDDIEKKARPLSDVWFVVEADGKVVFESGRITFADGAKPLDAAVPAGTHRLRLRVEPGVSNRWDHADWVAVRLEKEPNGRNRTP